MYCPFVFFEVLSCSLVVFADFVLVSIYLFGRVVSLPFFVDVSLCRSDLLSLYRSCRVAFLAFCVFVFLAFCLACFVIIFACLQCTRLAFVFLVVMVPVCLVVVLHFLSCSRFAFLCRVVALPVYAMLPCRLAALLPFCIFAFRSCCIVVLSQLSVGLAVVVVLCVVGVLPFCNVAVLACCLVVVLSFFR